MTSVVAGLSSIEASRRLAVDGPNQLPAPRRPSALRHFGKQFTHLLAILLWVASGLALLAGQPALAVAIVVVIVLNAIFAFAQEYRADRSAERLTLAASDERPGTSGRPVAWSVDATQLVYGDHLVLRSGESDQRRSDTFGLPCKREWRGSHDQCAKVCRRTDDRRYCCTDLTGAPASESLDRPTEPRSEDPSRSFAGALLGMAGLGMGLAPTKRLCLR